MVLNTKRSLLLILLTFWLLLTKAQTLYWIGGSGNFNDPKHWSLVSGGTSSFIKPNENSNVIFDDNSSLIKEDITISFNSGKNTIGGIYAYQKDFKVNLTSASSTSLNINGNVDLNSKISFVNVNEFFIIGSSAEASFFNPKGATFNGNINFIGDNRILSSIYNPNNDLFFYEGKFEVKRVVLSADRIYVKKENATFVTQNSYLSCSKTAELTNLNTIGANFKFLPKQSNTSNAKNSGVCSLNYSFVSAPCAGGTATITIVVNAGTCPPGPYTLFFNTTATCVPAFLPVSGSTVITLLVTGCANVALDLSLDDPFNNSVASALGLILPADPSPVSMTVLSTSLATCFGQCNARQRVRFLGGASPYNVTPPASGTVFTIPALTNYTVTNLCSGAVTYSLVDNNGCSFFFPQNIPLTPSITPSSITRSATCFGVCNGAYSVSAIGGTPNYSINFSNGTNSVVAPSTNAVANSLCVGPITATITDVNGCTVTVNSTITQPTSITTVPSQTNNLCFGNCAGVASVNVSGGTPPYTFTWSPVSGTNASVGGLCAGTETVVVRDFNLCTSTVNFNITQPASISIAATVTNVTCNGLCTGAASVNASGGTGAISFTWVAPGPATISTLPFINGQCPGTYTVFARDANLCLTQTVVTITQPPALSLTVNSQSIICFGACTGAATLNPSGGNGGPFTFTWSPSVSTSNTANALCAGVYNVSISDVSLCPINTVVTITQPSSITPNITSNSLTCNSVCNATIGASPTGGAGSYSFTLLTPTGATITSAPPFLGLCVGIHTLTIRDANLCSITQTINIAAPNALTITVNTASATCFNVCNGSATATAIGGTPGYTLSWNTGTSTVNGSIITNACAGNLTVTATDANACITNSVVSIIQPTQINATLTPTNPRCFGIANGSITAVAGGGTPAYTFTWSTGFNGNPITNLSAGPFTLTVTDANGCNRNFTTTLTNPPQTTLTINTNSIVCFGACTGAATVNPTGGNGAPFTFTWAPSVSTTSTAAALCAGPYTVSVSDASLCVTNSVLTIAQPFSITPNITSGSITCNALCNGTIGASPTGGQGPYTFSLITPAGATITTAPPFLGLCVGLHTLIVRDINLCSITRTVSITQPNPLVPSVSTTSITCFGSCNGGLSGSVLGGTPSYTLSWQTGSGPVAGGILTGLCIGTYTFNVLDANACTASSVVTLSQPPVINATINPVAPTCFGSCNGILSANATGGNPGYTLNWSNGFTGSPNTGLCAGNYTLTVTDATGCNRTFTTALVSPPAITVAVSTTSTSCAGSCNGSATVAVIGGNPAYTYQFNTLPLPTTNTTGIVSGLCAGNYLATVTDATGCSQSQNYTIAQPIALSAAITGSQNSCNACTGSATVTASNGTPGYTYVWTNSVLATVGTASIVNGLCVGNYTVTVTDSQTCTSTATLNIAQTVSVVVITGGGGIQCFGACTASATANPSGGTGPYTFTWSPTLPVQNTQTVTNLCAGSYTVLVSDQLGCSNTGTISFVNPAPINVAPTSTNPNCNGVCNGSINSNASGGTGPLTFSWSPGGQTTPNLTNLCAGTYTLRVTDANGCFVINTFTLNAPPAVTVALTNTNPSGCVVSNGSICAVPSGGTGSGYTFTWSPPGGTGINSSCYSNLGAGGYTVVVGNGAACNSTFVTSLTNPIGPTLTVASSSVSCFGGNNGSATVTASGIGGFTFTWSPVVPFVSFGNTSTASSLNTGTYNISVTDAGSGCITSTNVVIAQPSSLTVTQNVTNLTCNAVCNGSITLGLSGATPGYTLNWTPGIITGQGTQTVTNLCSGTYTATITDLRGCVVVRNFTVTQPSALSLTATPINVRCFGACNGTVNTQVNGGTGLITYNWPAVGPFLGATTPTIINLCPAIYTVTATDQNGCSRTATSQITQPTALTSTLSISQPICSGNCNGTATLNASGGTPTYSLSWSGSGITTNTIGGLCAGNYTGTVTDANGCTSTQGFTLNPAPNFSLNLTPVNPLCNGACNGSISTVVSGNQGTFAITWAPTGSGLNPTGLCASVYTATATDAQGCTALATANLISPAALLANVTTTSPLCNGNCNGIALSTPANAQGAVSFTWLPSGVTGTNSLVNQCANNNYTLLIQDAQGCTDSQTYTITTPPALNLSSSNLPSSCGTANGSITVLPTGGTPTYSFTWIPAVSTTSFATGLTAGVYTVNVSDINNCTNTLVIPLANANGPSSAVISVTNVVCNGGATGAASITNVTGGTPGYTLAWVSPPAPSTLNPITGLTAGGYTAQITDANSCVLFTGITVTQPSSITALPSFGFPTCNGICNGSISLNTSGGTPGYSYTWTPSAPNSSVFTNACAGNYTVQIRDINLCLTTQTINLPSIISLTSTINNTNNLCFGNCVGTASAISTSGGTPPYTFNWNTGATTTTINNLCNGIYTLTATDNLGCNNSFTTNITSPVQITAASTVASPSCGLCNGSSTITASGGTAPFTYSWTSGATGTQASSLCAGLYQVSITDFNGCNQLQNIAISNSNGITGETFSIQPILCSSLCNGAVTVSPIGGTAPITFSWTTPSSSSPSLTGLCAGTYFVQMTDAQGCIRTASTTLTPATNLTITPSIITPTACNANNGSINLVVTGGTLPYTFTWNPGSSSTATLSNIGAGSYSVTVGSNGCNQTQVFNINNLTGPALTFTQSNVRCFGACTGSIVALGTSTAPVTYSWSNGATTQSVIGLCPGLITLTVTANGCRTIRTFTITEAPPLNLSISNVQQPRCNNNCNGAITLIPSGGTLPFTFTWSPTPSGNVNPATALCSGSYVATVTDQRGCVRTETVSLINPPALILTNTITNSSCSNAADGSATITLSGGSPLYTYTWTGPNSFTTSATTTLTNLNAGTYSLLALDSRSCSITQTLEVVPTLTITADAGTNFTVCPLTNSIVLTGTNSVGANQYVWYQLPSTLTPVGNTSTLSVPQVINTASYVLQVLSTNTVCSDFDTVVVNMLSLPDVDAGPSYTIPVLSNVTIGGSPTSNSALTYTWMPPFTLNDGNIANPVASNTLNLTYTVFVTDVNGCINSDTMRVDIYPEIKIPNGFSPNGDSKNDTWIIDNIQQFPDCEVEVYNRWGELLFYSRGYNTPFNGKYQGKDLPVGTYYYIIKLNHPVFDKPFTGPLTIFR